MKNLQINMETKTCSCCGLSEEVTELFQCETCEDMYCDKCSAPTTQFFVVGKNICKSCYEFYIWNREDI